MKFTIGLSRLQSYKVTKKGQVTKLQGNKIFGGIKKMTGEKNRYKTLDKMWKLDDEQLKTPKHDEMVLWLLNKENIMSIFPNEIEKASQNIELKKEKIKKEISERERKIKNADVGFSVMFTKEELIENENDRIKELKSDLTSSKPNIRIISEKPIKADNGFLVGYWDVVINIKYLDLTIYIEVKPKITSFGATLRQLRTYMSYLSRRSEYIVILFTEDIRFKDAFESQGIKVISPPQKQSDLGEIFC